MTKKRTIFIAGATGRVGRQVVERLTGRHSLRLMARSRDNLAAVQGPNISVHPGSLADPAAVAEAMRGADIALTMIPSDHGATDFAEDQRAKLRGQVEGIKRSGVRQVVNLSSAGAHTTNGNGVLRVLHEMERALDALDAVEVLHLRPTFFFENSFYWIDLIRTRGITGMRTHPDAAFPMVATRDVADALARWLQADDFGGKRVVPLLGPKDYTLSELTAALATAIGLPALAYVAMPADHMKAGLVASGSSESFADAYIELTEGFGNQLLNHEQRSAETTTPTTAEQFSRETFAPAFARQA